MPIDKANPVCVNLPQACLCKALQLLPKFEREAHFQVFFLAKLTQAAVCSTFHRDKLWENHEYSAK
jgi:hypothetical protein